MNKYIVYTAGNQYIVNAYNESEAIYKCANMYSLPTYSIIRAVITN